MLRADLNGHLQVHLFYGSVQNVVHDDILWLLSGTPRLRRSRSDYSGARRVESRYAALESDPRTPLRHLFTIARRTH